MRKSLLVAVTSLLLAGVPVFGAAQSSKASNSNSKSNTSSSSTMQSTQNKSMANESSSQMRTHKIHGTVESVSNDQLAIKTAKGTEDTFTLQSSTKRSGDIAVGKRVTVWYKNENGAKDATRVVAAGGNTMKHSSMNHKGASNSSSGYGSSTSASNNRPASK